MNIRTLVLTAALPLVALRADAQQWAPTPAPAPVPSPAPHAKPAPSARPIIAATPAPQGFDGHVAYAQSGDHLPMPSGSANYPQDPADSVYKEARTLLNRGEWRRAATLFGQVADRQPASNYAADALYWKAFALHRIGGIAELREALTTLDARKSRFPRARNAEEADALTTRVTGALAARGDAAASTRLRSTAASGAQSCDSEELSVRASALSTLMRNDPSAATPILTRVLDRRDECSRSLRSSAVMILGRQDDAAARAKLADVAKNDPSPSVRTDAIGYLAEANTDEMATTLDGIIRTDTVSSVQRSAVRALGSMSTPRAKTMIRQLIERTSAPERLRLDAIASFDRRAALGNAYTYSYSCGSGQCDTPMAVALTEASVNSMLVTPRPPTPPTPAAAPVPPMPPSQSRSEAAEVRAAAAEARAASAEARASASADRAFGAALATTLGDMQVSRWNDDDRRISPEDAAWLRGVYTRLETNRLKSAAASVLSRAADDATMNWLIALVQREEEPSEVRANVLARIGRDMPIAQLGRLYDGASTRPVRSQIVEVLGRREEPEATDKLIDIVRNGTDPQLRRNAISALNSKKDPRTTQLLLELIDR